MFRKASEIIVSMGWRQDSIAQLQATPVFKLLVLESSTKQCATW